MTVPEFDALCREWVHADAVLRNSSTHTREGHQSRQRAPGAGRKWGLNPETRLVQALVWLQVYPTWEVLGYLFGVDESVARRSTRDVLSVLESLSTFVLELRSGRPRGRSLAQVIQAFPAVEILIDATEQRVRRPTGWEQQKPFYSGKKKTHTLKNQITVCAEDGRVLSVSASVPGSVHDLTLLCQSGLLDRLEPSEGVAVDKGLHGHRRASPGAVLLRAAQEASWRHAERSRPGVQPGVGVGADRGGARVCPHPTLRGAGTGVAASAGAPQRSLPGRRVVSGPADRCPLGYRCRTKPANPRERPPQSLFRRFSDEERSAGESRRG
jgi:hypothetical protein